MRFYDVWLADEVIATVSDQPGRLISALAPPPRPSDRPATSTFLSATAFAPEHEGRLRELLDRSTSLDEFLSALRANGYRVVVRAPGEADG
jgi:hypothetical protein